MTRQRALLAVSFAAVVCGLAGRVDASCSKVERVSFQRALRGAVICASRALRTGSPMDRAADGAIQVRSLHRQCAGEELYDLRQDPFELDNQAGNPKLAAVLDGLSARLDSLDPEGI